MARRLPPLKALRAFEAGARYLSFTRAAEDLSVTQTAVSHQVRGLEEWIGTRLFRRGARRLALTEAGKILYPAVADGFDRIAEAAARVSDLPDRRTLTVSVSPTFGSRWLAHRLGRFWRAQPDVDLQIQHTVRLADLTRDEVDVAVRWGHGRWSGTVAERLMEADRAPLCAPALLEEEHPLRAPSDLGHHTLLHERDHQEWAEWLAAAGAREVDGRRGPVIDDPNALIHAAIDGYGVMMGIPALLAEEIADGRLVTPFGPTLDPRFAYYLVYLPGALERPKVAAFREFLLREAGHGEGGAPAPGG